MSVNANESIHKAHKDALTIVKSSASLVAAVEQAATHAPYWIDATSYPSKRMPDLHEPKIKLCYVNLVTILRGLNRAQLRSDSKCFTQIRLNGPYRTLLGVFPSAHFGAWELGDDRRQLPLSFVLPQLKMLPNPTPDARVVQAWARGRLAPAPYER